MLLQLLFLRPMLGVAWLAALVLSLTVHEFAHAAVGKWRGDDTAERMGRLTLNPLAHLDVFGFLMLVAVGFGWARPVPFNPRNLRNPVVDGLWISLAGPGANLVFAAVAAIVFRLLAMTDVVNLGTALGAFLILLVLVNLFLMVFNLIPIYPLDGAKVLDVLLPGTRAAGFHIWLLKNGGRILMIAVIISLLTPIDPFAFIQTPAFWLCDQLLGSSCSGLLGVYFGG